jgi:hypothetical protein
MVRTDAKVRKEQLLAAGMVTSAVWLDRHENRVEILRRFRGFSMQPSTRLGEFGLVEDAEKERLLFCLVIMGMVSV